MNTTGKQNPGYRALASGKEGNSFAPTSAPQSAESLKTGIGRKILFAGLQASSWIIVRLQANDGLETADVIADRKTLETPAALSGFSFIPE